jgi:hypothetical protein
MVDKQLYFEASIALKSSLLTKADLERYALLKRRFNQALTTTMRIIRKSAESSKKEHIEDELDVYLTWEEGECMQVYGMSARCVDLFQHTTLLEAYNAQFGIIDKLEVVPQENKFNGSISGLMHTTLTDGRKYTGWVTI